LLTSIKVFSVSVPIIEEYSTTRPNKNVKAVTLPIKPYKAVILTSPSELRTTKLLTSESERIIYTEFHSICAGP
jgi:hypothetical protein